MAIDLHIHTTASDGILTPTEVVNYAVRKGLKAIAITDHDTIVGNAEALKEGERQNLTVIQGVEISVEFLGGTMHILGYLIDYKNETLCEKLRTLQKFRAERNPRIVEKLNKLGMQLKYEEVEKLAQGGQVGRPHFARLMVQKGYVGSEQEAFDKFLKKGAPAYEEKTRLSPSEAISLILDAKGIPVLAHPFTLNCKNLEELEQVVRELIEAGLKGIEAYYSEHSDKETLEYQQLSSKYGLLITGGSDFHGDKSLGIDMGTGRGNLNIPDEILNELFRVKKAYKVF